MVEKYSKFCYDRVGSYALNYLEYFQELRQQLTMANMDISLPEYVSILIFTPLIVGTSSFALFSSIFLISMGLSGLIVSFIISIVSMAVSAALIYIYPRIIIKNRSTKIKDTLPFATMYLSTLAGTGTSLEEIFSNLSEVDEYGEVSEEASKISRDIETFGMDISEALERAARRTPSDDFEELVWGINHVITTGGSLKEFLEERSEKLMEDYERRIESFTSQLSLLVEMYITLVIVGSIIFTAMSAIISTFASGISPGMIVNIQVAAIFFGLPMISGMFILIIDGMAPGGIR